jgi:hypothetical protein
MVSGVSVQVSGAMKIQRTEYKGQAVSVFCHLIRLRRKTQSASGGTPIIKPCFVNCLQDTTLEVILKIGFLRKFFHHSCYN